MAYQACRIEPSVIFVLVYFFVLVFVFCQLFFSFSFVPVLQYW